MLQPHVSRLEQPAVPENCATEFVFSYPQPTSQNYAGRPQTMVWGTAPYMAQGGAPGDLIGLDDELRPQSTKQFGKVYVDTYGRNTHPLQNVECKLPQRVWAMNPSSTRAEGQNCLFGQRYLSQ